MNQPPSTESAEAAAAWYARLNADDAGAADRKAFAEWRAASPENGRAWDAVSLISARLGAIGGDPALEAMRAEARAAIASPARRAYGWRALAAGVALLALAGGGAFLIKPRTPAQKPATEIAVREYRTAVGQRATVTLSDGSTMTLNTNSLVRVPAWHGERQVELARGEAFFQVAKDPIHPFIVAGAGNRVTALGTAFSVRIAQRHFAVALTEGTVKVDMPGAGRSTVLHQGDTLETDAGDVHVKAAGAERAVDWLEGRISFDAVPLRQVVSEMNRYSARKLVLQDGSLGDVPFSGVFDTNGGDALVSALEGYRIAKVARRDARELVLVRY